MRLMKLERAIIVGHSMGGSVALQYALDHPQKIRGLILIGSSGVRRTPDEEVPSTFGLADISWLQPILRYVTPRFMIERGLRDSVADPDNFVTDEQVTRYWELIRMTGSREAMLQRRSLGNKHPAAGRPPRRDYPADAADMGGARQAGAAGPWCADEPCDFQQPFAGLSRPWAFADGRSTRQNRSRSACVCERFDRQLKAKATLGLRLGRDRIHWHGFANFHHQCPVSRRFDKALARLLERLE
jgi:pimeloyl-ACP methyl ester carboxylesterase